MVSIDHVAIAAIDLDRAAARLLDEVGLASVPGGRHPRWGTANRIVPLGDTYLELITVEDEMAATASVFGSAVVRAVSDGDRWLTWAVRDDRIDATAARLGLTVEAGERARPDGRVLRWRTPAPTIQAAHRSFLSSSSGTDPTRSIRGARASIIHRERAGSPGSSSTAIRPSWIDGRTVPNCPSGSPRDQEGSAPWCCERRTESSSSAER